MQPDIVPWTPPKAPSYRFFQRANDGHLLASYHPTWSITWGWFLMVSGVNRKRGERGRFFGFSRFVTPSDSGNWSVTALWLFTVSYHWQQLMRWPPSMMCTRCGQRRSGDDMTYCGREGCKLRTSREWAEAAKLYWANNDGARPQ